MKVRIKFMKQGTMKFVGHLDFLRYFQKAMRRAAVDIKYSEGFSPHQIMSFASPLGVGLTSQGEYLDIEVHTTENSAVMIGKLNQAMADGVKILSYRKLDDSAKNAMSIVAAADYSITIRESAGITKKEQWLSNFIDFCHSGSIVIVKKTKRGEKEMDIRPFIYAASKEQDQIQLTLSTGSVDNIKPELVLQSYCEAIKQTYQPLAFSIQREEVYAAADSGGKKFVTLESLGEEIE